MPYYPSTIKYSDKLKTKEYEYVNVTLPKVYLPKLTKNKLLIESEWKSLGIELSNGNWENFMIYKPEPHVLLFRKKL